MPRTMEAAVLRQLRGKLRIEELPVPRPGPDEVLIRIAACGVCHSDVHAVDGDWTPRPMLPLIPGHEAAGHVAGRGRNVKSLKEGDRVGVPWMFSACGACELCLEGYETVCAQGQATGYTVPGGYAEYMVAPAAYVGRIPDGLDLAEAAPVLCAGVTTYRGLRRSGARPGEWCAVVGIGGLGHIAVQYAKAMGLHVAAVDIAEAKLDLARGLGADLAVNAAEEDAPSAIRKATGGVHAALVTAVSPRAYAQAIAALRPEGVCSFIALPGGEADILSLSISAVVNGVSHCRCPCCRDRYWCSPCPSSCAKVMTSRILSVKLIRIYGCTLGTVLLENAPPRLPGRTSASIQFLSKNSRMMPPARGLKAA